MSILVSEAAEDFNSFTVLTHRAIVTLAVLAPFTFSSFCKSASHSIIWKRGLFASISIALFFFALQMGSPAAVAAYFGITPICVVILGYVFLKERINTFGIIAISLVVLGVAMVKIPNVDELSATVFGICFVGSLFRAGSYTMIRAAKVNYASNLWVFSLSICILILTLCSGQVQWKYSLLDNWILWAISLSSILMQLTLVYSYKNLIGSKATALEESNTIWILLLQVWILSHPTSIYEILGIGLIVTGNILIHRK